MPSATVVVSTRSGISNATAVPLSRTPSKTTSIGMSRSEIRRPVQISAWSGPGTEIAPMEMAGSIVVLLPFKTTKVPRWPGLLGKNRRSSWKRRAPSHERPKRHAHRIEVGVKDQIVREQRSIQRTIHEAASPRREARCHRCWFLHRRLVALSSLPPVLHRRRSSPPPPPRDEFSMSSQHPFQSGLENRIYAQKGDRSEAGQLDGWGAGPAPLSKTRGLSPAPATKMASTPW